jgi:NAD(P)-dependent dehydrogenase (short-subunit alcohol dehydrogenase family)
MGHTRLAELGEAIERLSQASRLRPRAREVKALLDLLSPVRYGPTLTSIGPEMNKIALITGGGSGIGRAAALALLKHDWTVVITGRRREALDATVATAGSAASRLIPLTADVGDPFQVRQLFDQIRQQFGRLDLLFNNAGVSAPPVPVDELSFEQWQTVVNVNLTGSFLCAQAAFKLMKEQSPQGGRIINNGSVSAYAPRPNSAPYTSTKHAITGLTKSLALDGRLYRIACGQIDIGNADTEMASKMKAGVPQANGDVRVEPTMDVAHVADAIVHMAGLPLDANVLSVTLMATNMPFVGRG